MPSRSSVCSPARVEQALTAAGVHVVPVELPLVQRFPELKRIDMLSRDAQRSAGIAPGSVSSLSLADITCLAYPLEHELPVLTGDAHWCTLKPFGLGLPVFDFRDAAVIP